ncbi:MAG: TolC family protein [Bacteroidales bacterium]|nr:TolC family protein [Bacteroidales bacterium]MCF8387567.1 TolC family protein [Bacteroidales bacterium]MCF8399151.1 TolC family protein [Bacteroidales bacterium]
MKTKLISATGFLFLNMLFAHAQDPIQEVLLQVQQNNKSIQKYEQFTQSRIMGAKTNLTPSNPSFEMDYLWGDEPGTYLREIGISQEFDFPSVYTKQNKIANKQEEKFMFQQQKFTWEILHKTSLLCLELIYLNRLEGEYVERLSAAGIFLKNQEKRLEQGYGNILEVDKARLHEKLIGNELRRIRSKIRVKLNHLQELNGGEKVLFEDSVYPQFEPVPQIDSLFEKMERLDPVNKIIVARIQESDLEVGLAKAKSYPEFEVGYKSEEEFLNKFDGLHFGISIPLWENRNRVKYSKLKTDYLHAEIAEHENTHYYKIKETYESFLSARERLNSLDKTLKEMRFEDKLNKALIEGNIDRIDFYSEYVYLYDIRDELLETEKEYYLLLAELFKYKLLEINR